MKTCITKGALAFASAITSGALAFACRDNPNEATILVLLVAAVMGFLSAAAEEENHD